MSFYNFYNGTFTGVSFATGFSPSIPEPSSYDKVTFYGGSTGNGYVIDKVYGQNITMTEDWLNSNSNLQFAPQWDINTYLLSEYDGSFSGGNVSNITSAILNWIIYRTETGSDTLKYLDTVDISAEEYVDYTALKGNSYQYYLFGKNDTEISAPLVTDSAESEYDGWFLVDIENQKSYNFNLNFSGGDLTQVENIAEYETNKTYKAYSKGATNYVEGTITALIMDDLCDMEQSVGILSDLKELIFSEKLKYLKDNKGRIFKVFTYGYSDNMITNGLINEPRYVSFSFREAGEV